jgi:hypothetical protein
MPTATLDAGLEHELALVKSALLYADHVTLASTNAIQFGALLPLTTADSRARREALIETVSALPGNERVADVYRDLSRRRRRLSPHERLALMRLEAALREHGDEVAETTETLLSRTGIAELQRAMDAGLLGIDLLNLEGVKPGEFADRAVEGLVDALARAVSNRARTYPLFDDGVGNLVASLIRERRISYASPSRGKQMGAAGMLISQLEAFPGAEMDVVLDVRERLAGPLVRFRAALAEASAELESPAWETDEFAREVDDLYHRRVAPALLELEEAMRELGALAMLRRVASDVETVKAAAFITVAAAAGVGLAHLPEMVFGAPVVAAAARETQWRADARRDRGTNDFYFLYEANRLLGHSR